MPTEKKIVVEAFLEERETCSVRSRTTRNQSILLAFVCGVTLLCRTPEQELFKLRNLGREVALLFLQNV